MNSLERLDARQQLLAAVTLLLLLVHMVFPDAGVDEVSVALLLFLAVTLYGNEMTAWLARYARPTTAGVDSATELADRVREVGYKVEHARVAASTEQMPAGKPVRDEVDALIERAGGKPRAALILAWHAIDGRLRDITGAREAGEAARLLVETGRAPAQFQDALNAFRRLRMDVARSIDGVSEDALWTLVALSAEVLALIPPAEESRDLSPTED